MISEDRLKQSFEGGYLYKGNGLFQAYCETMSEECEKTFEVGQLYIQYAPAMTTEKARSKLQNKSMHLWFSMLAKWLDSNGFSVAMVIAKLAVSTVKWTPEAVKELLWRNIQRVMVGKESTAKISTKDCIVVKEAVDHFCVERLGGRPPEWPDRFTLMDDE